MRAPPSDLACCSGRAARPSAACVAGAVPSSRFLRFTLGFSEEGLPLRPPVVWWVALAVRAGCLLGWSKPRAVGSSELAPCLLVCALLRFGAVPLNSCFPARHRVAHFPREPRLLLGRPVLASCGSFSFCDIEGVRCAYRPLPACSACGHRLCSSRPRELAGRGRSVHRPCLCQASPAHPTAHGHRAPGWLQQRRSLPASSARPPRPVRSPPSVRLAVPLSLTPSL